MPGEDLQDPTPRCSELLDAPACSGHVLQNTCSDCMLLQVAALAAAAGGEVDHEKPYAELWCDCAVCGSSDSVLECVTTLQATGLRCCSGMQDGHASQRSGYGGCRHWYLPAGLA